MSPHKTSFRKQFENPRTIRTICHCKHYQIEGEKQRKKEKKERKKTFIRMKEIVNLMLIVLSNNELSFSGDIN